MPRAPADLTPAGFNILLALTREPLHGYAIQQRVKNSTDGRVKLGPGTLYTTIKRLLETSLIRETDTRPEDDDERRRYYELTPAGLEVVRTEAQHLERLVNVARDAKLLRRAT